jgi:hypothetical protein
MTFRIAPSNTNNGGRLRPSLYHFTNHGKHKQMGRGGDAVASSVHRGGQDEARNAFDPPRQTTIEIRIGAETTTTIRRAGCGDECRAAVRCVPMQQHCIRWSRV